MLVPDSLMAVQMSAYRPRRSSPPTARRTTNVSPSDSCQSISMRRSALAERRRRLGQSERWIEIPRPWVTYPTTRSPGTGWQHWAYRTISPSTPWILMPRPSRSRSITRPNAVGLGAWSSSAGRSGYSARIMVPSAMSPRPSAACSCSAVPTERSVAARSLTVLADFRVHRKREVDRRRALRQALHVAAGGEDEDLVLVEVDLQELEKLLGRVGVLLQLEQLAEPREMAVQLVRALATFLEQPVRRDAVLRGVVHLMGPDLDLVQLTARSEHGGVERLVAVGLRARDVVLDPLLQRGPLVVDHAQHVVALGDIVHQHAHREEVVDLLERLVALLHFLVNRPEVLGAAGDLVAGESGSPQLLGERDPEPLDGFLTLALPRLDLARQRAVVLGLEKLACEVLELGLHARHAEAVRQRRVDLAGLERDAAPLLRVQVLESPPVVQPVGELDDDDAGVLRDRQQKLAVVLRLLLRSEERRVGKECRYRRSAYSAK